MQDSYPCERIVLYIVNQIRHTESQPVWAVPPGHFRKQEKPAGNTQHSRYSTIRYKGKYIGINILERGVSRVKKCLLCSMNKL